MDIENLFTPAGLRTPGYPALSDSMNLWKNINFIGNERAVSIPRRRVYSNVNSCDVTAVPSLTMILLCG